VSYPALPAQRAIGFVRCHVDDEPPHAEVMVLPNLILWWTITPEGTRIGDSRVISPQWARQFLPALRDLSEHVTECEGSTCGHVGVTMEVLDPDEALA
jgi:hypothetical protein